MIIIPIKIEIPITKNLGLNIYLRKKIKIKMNDIYVSTYVTSFKYLCICILKL